MRNALLTLTLAMMVSFAGCQAIGHYAIDRVMDVADIVDLKLGAGLGVGAKVEVTDYVASGVGLGWTLYEYEFYGRRAVEKGGIFLYLGLVGGEGGTVESSDTEGVFFLYHHRSFSSGKTRLPLIERFRIGGEIWLPISFGAYVNLGEIVDFIGGLVLFDLADDDGISKTGRWYEYVSESQSHAEQALELLSRRDTERRIQGAKSLSTLGNYSKVDTIPPLIDALDDRKSEVRVAVAEALGKLFDRRAVGPLIKALDDDSNDVRIAAASALENLTKEKLGTNKAAWERWLKQHE